MKRTRLVSALPLLAVAVACSGEVGSPQGVGLGGAMGAGSGTAMEEDGANPSNEAGMEGTPSPGGGATPGEANPEGPNDGAGLGLDPPEDEGPSEELLDALSNAEPLPLVLDGMPDRMRVVRLTHTQWENSVRQLLSVGDTGQSQNLAGDVSGLHTFSNHEELLFVNANLYSDYQLAAEELAAAVGVDGAQLSAIYPGMDAAGFIQTVGRRAYRRPLSDSESAALQTVFDTASELAENGASPFARGAAAVLQALMQSPGFLYRTELSAAGSRLNSFELAAKLSLALLGTPPDDALLDQAASGALDTDAGVESTARNMLEQPAAVEVMRNFHGELLRFNRFATITKDQQTVPDYQPTLNDELLEASYRFFDRIFTESLGVRDILTTTVGYAGPQMAELYGVQGGALGGPQGGQGMQEHDFGAERPGYFSQLPFLVLNSVNLTPDPIHRGVELNHSILCAEVPPPGGVAVSLPGELAGSTNRERITEASGPGTCGASCHAPYINPLGFAFENFDGLGRQRELDNGLPVVTEATYPFTEGTLTYSGAPQLMQYIADGEQAHACYAKNIATFGLQRELAPADQQLLDSLTDASRAGSSVKDLLVQLVTHPAFTTRANGGAL